MAVSLLGCLKTKYTEVEDKVKAQEMIDKFAAAIYDDLEEWEGAKCTKSYLGHI